MEEGVDEEVGADPDSGGVSGPRPGQRPTQVLFVHGYIGDELGAEPAGKVVGERRDLGTHVVPLGQDLAE
jgi:hypothetical protein